MYYNFRCKKDFKLEGKSWNKHFNFPFYMGVSDDSYLSYEIEKSIVELTQKYVTDDIVCQYTGMHLSIIQFSPQVCIK